MTSELMLTDERLLANLGAEVRSLVGAIRESLADLMFAPGRRIATEFLAIAPAAECVRLADAWAAAEAVGLPVGVLKAGLATEDQLLLEMITAVYPTAVAGRTDLLAAGRPDLTGLVDELARDHALCPAS